MCASGSPSATTNRDRPNASCAETAIRRILRAIAAPIAIPRYPPEQRTHRAIGRPAIQKDRLGYWWQIAESAAYTRSPLGAPASVWNSGAHAADRKIPRATKPAALRRLCVNPDRRSMAGIQYPLRLIHATEMLQSIRRLLDAVWIRVARPTGPLRRIPRRSLPCMRGRLSVRQTGRARRRRSPRAQLRAGRSRARAARAIRARGAAPRRGPPS